MYALARRATAARRGRWSALAVAATLAAMLSKEVGVMLPAAALAYDYVFVHGHTAERPWRRAVVYLGMAACALAYVPLGVGDITRGDNAGFGMEHVRPLHYFLTQTQIHLLVYVRKILWPHPLVLDYEWLLVRTYGEAAWSLLVVSAAAGAAAWGVWRKRWWGFAGAWWLVVMAPTTLMPVADLAFEHRVYLPLATIAALAVGGLWRLSASVKVVAAVCIALAIPLSVLTVWRNTQYRDAASIWQTVLAVRPRNPRANNDYANTFTGRGRAIEAIPYYRLAVQFDPGNASYHSNYGVALAQLGRDEQAAAMFQAAIRLDPDFAEAVRNMSRILEQNGRFAEAVAYRRRLVELDPDDLADHRGLAMALHQAGEAMDAAEQYRLLLRRAPDDVVSLNNLASLHATEPSLLDPAEAVRLARRAADLTDHRQAWVLDTLAVAQAAAGDRAAAITSAERALSLARAAGDAALVERLEAMLAGLRDQAE